MRKAINLITALVALKFGRVNAKLKGNPLAADKTIVTFSLPAAWTCPGANLCKARVARDGGLVDGPNVEFRCWAASLEAIRTNVRNAHWHNFDMLKPYLNDARKMADIIGQSLPRRADIVRVHESGDFFNDAYFRAWCLVAAAHPNVLFYAYTKSLKTWIANRAAVPANLVLTASRGGLWDELIDKHGLKTARVVFSIEQASKLGLTIDHDDSAAMDANIREFALLLHGVQPAKSEASRALVALKGIGSYSENTAENHARAARVNAQF